MREDRVDLYQVVYRIPVEYFTSHPFSHYMGKPWQFLIMVSSAEDTPLIVNKWPTMTKHGESMEKQQQKKLIIHLSNGPRPMWQPEKIAQCKPDPGHTAPWQGVADLGQGEVGHNQVFCTHTTCFDPLPKMDVFSISGILSKTKQSQAESCIVTQPHRIIPMLQQENHCR